jgi:hypothetical protein
MHVNTIGASVELRDLISTRSSSPSSSADWVTYWSRARIQPISDASNTTWPHPAFRGYADHLIGQEFAPGLFELLTLALGLRTAVMCSEILWWRCHRRMIADVLVSLGVHVIHIMDAKTARAHRLRAPARLVSGVLTYVPEGSAA